MTGNSSERIGILNIIITNPAPKKGNYARLLDAATPLPMPEDDTNPLRWLAGVKLLFGTSECRSIISTLDVDACAEADYNVGAEANCISPSAEFLPFRLNDALTGSTLNGHTRDSLAGYLDQGWDVAVSAAFGSRLLDMLAVDAVAPTVRAFGTAAVTVETAIAIIEDELAASLSGRRGTIHLSPGAFGLIAESLVQEGGLYFTRNGTLVVADPGYAAARTPDALGATAATGLLTYIYGTGEIFYQQSPADYVDTNPSQSTDITRNTITRLKSTFGLLAYQSCVIVAVLATLDTEMQQP